MVISERAILMLLRFELHAMDTQLHTTITTTLGITPADWRRAIVTGELPFVEGKMRIMFEDALKEYRALAQKESEDGR